MRTDWEKDLLEKMKNIKTIPYDDFIKLTYGMFIIKAVALDSEKEEAVVIADMLLKHVFEVALDRFNLTEKELRLAVLNCEAFKSAEERFS